MSYTCSVCNELHSNATRVLVPVSKRKVIYRKCTVKNLKNIKDVDLNTIDPDNLIFLDEYEGWETAKEIPVCEAKAKEIEELNANNFMLEPKYVTFIVKTANKKPYKRNSDYNAESEEDPDKYSYE